MIECSQENFHFNRAQNFRVNAHSLVVKSGERNNGQQMGISFLFKMDSVGIIH